MNCVVYGTLLNDRTTLDTLGNAVYEAPFAFVLDKPLDGPGVTLFEVLSATCHVVPAIEIMDALIEQFDRDTKAPRKVFDTIIDFAADAGIVLGDRPVKPMAVDLRWVGAMLHKNGVIEETSLAAAVLNHPATGVARLANKISPYDEALNAGEIPLAGSFTRPAPAIAVDGVDGVFFGPADLAASMGYHGQANHPELQHAILDGICTVRAAGKAAGLLMVNRKLHRPISTPQHCSSWRASKRHCSSRPRQGRPAVSPEKTLKSEIVTQSRKADAKPASRPGTRHTQPSHAVSFGSSRVTHI